MAFVQATTPLPLQSLTQFVTYALSIALNEALLLVGRDIARTDVPVAPY